MRNWNISTRAQKVLFYDKMEKAAQFSWNRGKSYE